MNKQAIKALRDHVANYVASGRGEAYHSYIVELADAMLDEAEPANPWQTTRMRELLDEEEPTMSSPIERLAQIKAKTAGHTPGPWWTDDMGMFVFVDRDDPHIVGEARGWGWLQYKGEDAAMREQEANAHMLAAAPDLLDIATELAGEVERLREALEEIRYTSIHDTRDGDDVHSIVDAALTPQEDT